MGLYDRDYSRGPEPGFQITAPTTVTMQLLLITGAAYVAQFVFGPRFDQIFGLHSDWFYRPWEAYQLLTYGFLHSRDDIGHILVNMFVLWMFGREVEQRYGRREFVFFYLAAIVAAGLSWSLSEAAAGSASAVQLVDVHGQMLGFANELPRLVGASGGISGIVALFALNFPHRQVLMFFVIPMPMWVAAVLGLLWDVKGAMDRTHSNIAFTAHLGGALFGLAYYHFRWSLSGLVPERLRFRWPRARPKLRVHEPDEEDELSQKVDAILQKIQEQGQESLTWNERRLLEKASRRYQEKRK